MDKFLYSLLRYIDKKQSRSFMDTGKDLFIIRTKSSGSATIPTERYYCYQQPFKKNYLYNWNAQSNNGTTNFDNLSNYSMYSCSSNYQNSFGKPVDIMVLKKDKIYILPKDTNVLCSYIKIGEIKTKSGCSWQ
jgi:hypothetical protein